MISFELDRSGFEALTQRLETRLPSELAAVAFDLGERGEQLVKQAMVDLIYSQPERGYERTEELLRSAYGYGQRTAEGFDVVIGAVGGAEGRDYALYVNRGTYGSRIESDRILSDARAKNDFAPQAYPRGQTGVEARPFNEPALAQLARELKDDVLRAISLAAR